MHLKAEGDEIKVLDGRMGPHSFIHQEGQHELRSVGK